jgi:L-seryl-tRNA(Ser) seleniumtransferase
LILRVHPSNYRIVGFTAAPKLAELAQLAHTSGLLLYEDAGSGALFNLQAFGLDDEPVIRESLASGADIVSFSGDKLLGAAQAGLIVGRDEFIERLRRAPLYRALRADKLALAALEATLEAHARGASFTEVPALRMLAEPLAQLQKRARAFARRLHRRSSLNLWQSEIIVGQSAIGGGSAPMTHPPTALIALSHRESTAVRLEQLLREARPPVIARIVDDRVVLDLRTIAEDEESELLDALLALEDRLLTTAFF